MRHSQRWSVTMPGNTKHRRAFEDIEQHRNPPTPACIQQYHTNRRGHRGPGVAARWITKEWTAARSAFRRPCRNDACFPDGGGPTVGEIVVESQRSPTVVHRLSQPQEPHTDSQTYSDKTPDWPDSQPLASIGDLRIGDAVAWNTRQTPLTVTTTEWPLQPQATVRGPDGGTYSFEERSHRDFWVYPSPGRVARVVHFPTHSETDSDTSFPE
jgi:hypothetical protein